MIHLKLHILTFVFTLILGLTFSFSFLGGVNMCFWFFLLLYSIWQTVHVSLWNDFSVSDGTHLLPNFAWWSDDVYGIFDERDAKVSKEVAEGGNKSGIPGAEHLHRVYKHTAVGGVALNGSALTSNKLASSETVNHSLRLVFGGSTHIYLLVICLKNETVKISFFCFCLPWYYLMNLVI